MCRAFNPCPVQALGLDEGHAVCQALQDVKLAVNAGSYSQLESASGAVAVCVLADWFEGFTDVSMVEFGHSYGHQHKQQQ